MYRRTRYGVSYIIFRSLIGLNCDFWDKSENLRRIILKNLISLIENLFLQKIIDFSSIMSVFWLYRLEIILYDKGTLCIIYFACLFASLFITINVKMAEPIWLKFCVGPHMTLGKVYGMP